MVLTEKEADPAEPLKYPGHHEDRVAQQRGPRGHHRAQGVHQHSHEEHQLGTVQLGQTAAGNLDNVDMQGIECDSHNKTI